MPNVFVASLQNRVQQFVEEELSGTCPTISANLSVLEYAPREVKGGSISLFDLNCQILMFMFHKGRSSVTRVITITNQTDKKIKCQIKQDMIPASDRYKVLFDSDHFSIGKKVGIDQMENS